MSAIEVKDPAAIINSLTARITQLERQIEIESRNRNADLNSMVGATIKRLRLHCVIPLYVGDRDFADVRKNLLNQEPSLRDVVDQLWDLNLAPLNDKVKADVKAVMKSEFLTGVIQLPADKESRQQITSVLRFGEYFHGGRITGLALADELTLNAIQHET